jgi:hypothetical protein
MTSKTKQSGRADILVRMSPRLKERIGKAASEHGLTNNDWLLDVIKDALAAHDAEVAARERKQDLESRIESKFQEIMASLAGGDLTGLKAAAFARLQEKAEATIAKWRAYAQTFSHAEPRSPIELLCRDYCDLEAKLEDVRQIHTIDDEGYGYDPDDPDGDEPEPEDELAAPGAPDAE